MSQNYTGKNLTELRLKTSNTYIKQNNLNSTLKISKFQNSKVL